MKKNMVYHLKSIGSYISSYNSEDRLDMHLLFSIFSSTMNFCFCGHVCWELQLSLWTLQDTWFTPVEEVADIYALGYRVWLLRKEIFIYCETGACPEPFWCIFENDKDIGTWWMHNSLEYSCFTLLTGACLAFYSFGFWFNGSNNFKY